MHTIIRRALSVLALLPMLLCMTACREDADGLVLVRDGEPEAVILLADGADEGQQAAARELNYWIGRISGAELTVVEHTEWDGRMPVLSLGLNPFAVQRGVTEEILDGLGPESARIVIGPDAALLAGRGCPLNPVMEFVKFALDVRWIMPGEVGEVFEPRATLRVTPGDWTWDTRLPDFRRIRAGRFVETDAARERIVESMGEAFTEGYWAGTWPAVARDTQRWMALHRVDVGRVRIGHAYGHWWERYGEAHPEWFATLPAGRVQRGGHGVKLCISHPQVAETVVRDWLAEDRPAGHRDLRIMPNDSRNYCVCAACRAWDAPEMQALSDAEISNSDRSNVTDRYVRFWNRVAELAVRTDPDVRLTTYAYRSYEHPPSPGLQVHPNVWVGLVTGEGYYPDEPVRDYWKRWADAGASLFWRPNLLHSGHGMPYIFARPLGRDLAFFHAHRMVGADFDSLTGHWGTQGLNYYVAAEMITRPNADVEDVIGEYYRAFGSAAPAVRDYFEYWHETTLRGPALLREHSLVASRTWGGWWPAFVRLAPLLYTDGVLDAGEAHLRRAEGLAERDRAVVRDRVAVLRAGFDHSRKTARAIADAVTASESRGPEAQQAALRSQAELMHFRRRVMVSQPLAVNVPYLAGMERRRDLMWQTSVDWSADLLMADRQLMDVGWRIRLDPEDRGRGEGWYRVGGDEGWQPGLVAMPWREALPGAAPSRVAWYGVLFDGPDSDTGEERVLLHFSSVDAAVEIWINGEKVAERPYPFEGDRESWRKPFEVDITRIVTHHAKNMLVVRVESDQENGGITGRVSLVLAR